MDKKRTAVLISGRGSNMTALIEAAGAPDYPAEISLVLSNKPKAKGLETARAAGIRTGVIDHRHYEDRGAFEAEITKSLEAADIELVCLAGFMRLLSEPFVQRWRDQLINIHPSLLPAFPGVGTHARALETGVKIHGCTVHFVREAMDDGPIIAQAAVPVLPNDDEDKLATRVLEAEHKLYPMALALAASGAIHVSDELIVFDRAPEADHAAALFSPA